MRKVLKNIIAGILVGCGVIFVIGAAYASVTFIGDIHKRGFGATKKISPVIDFTCPEGQDWYNGKCTIKCDRTTYPLDELPDENKGTVNSCMDAWGTYYTYTDCHNGWDLIEGNCTPTDCSGFTYNSEPGSVAGTVTSCKSANDTFYKYISCHEGWDFANGVCNIHNCNTSTYPYTSNPGNNAGTIVTCKTGVATQYGYSDCHAGWDKSSGYCNIHTCDANAFPFNSQPSNSIGTVASCPTGSDTKYGYSSCTSDYNLVNGQCEPKCTYALTSKPTGCATVADSCEKNGTIYYDSTCTACDSGYTLGNGTCTACTWDGLSLSACPRYGTCSNNTCGEITKYGLDSCGFGFDASNGSCVLHSYAIGDVFAYNGTNIGVVYRVENNGYKVRIAALSQVNASGTAGNTAIKWQNSAKDASTTNISNTTTAANDMNGQSNTDQLISFSDSQTSTSYKVNPALGARAYAPSACGAGSFCAKGKWYLPSLGEMKAMYDNKSKMTSGVSSAGGTAFGSSYYYWTSTEYNASYAWRLYWSSGARAYTSKTNTYYLRPSLQVDICEVNGLPYDSATGECLDCSTYTFTSCPTGATCASSDCSGSTKYKVISCNDGYIADGDSCKVNECYGYDLASCPARGTCENKTCDGVTWYKVTSCATGYYVNNNTCAANTCSGYSASLTGCQTYDTTDTCLSGTVTKYKSCTNCYTGYSLSNGKCSKTCTYTATSVPSNCLYSDSCERGSASGTATYYECAHCVDNYVLHNGACREACFVAGSCSIGDVYASSYNHAAGVVFYNDSVMTKVIAFYNVDKSGNINETAKSDWNMFSLGLGSQVSTSDGKSNTDLIMELYKERAKTWNSSAKLTPEPAYATSIFSNDCASWQSCGAGNWYLPANDEYYQIHDNLSTLNAKLVEWGGHSLGKLSYYTTSTVSGTYPYYTYYSGTWEIRTVQGATFYVRPALVVCKEGLVYQNGTCM